MPIRRPQRSPNAPSDELFLPEAELEVLASLVQQGEATAAELRQRLKPFRPMSHASVDTLLQRLMTKQRVARRKADRGKAFVYFSLADGEPALAGAAGRLLDRVFGGDTVSLVASLFGSHTPSRDELDRLRTLVDERYREQARIEDAP